MKAVKVAKLETFIPISNALWSFVFVPRHTVAVLS